MKARIFTMSVFLSTMSLALVYCTAHQSTKEAHVVTSSTMEPWRENPEETIKSMDSARKYWQANEAIKYEIENRLAVQNDITKLQVEIRSFCQQNPHVCYHFKHNKVRQRIKKDMALLAQYPHYDYMLYGLNLATAMLSSKSDTITLLSGEYPEKAQIDWNKPAFLGGTNKDIKGSAKMLGLIVSLAYIGNELTTPAGKPLISFADNKYPAISYVAPEINNTDYSFMGSKKEAILFRNGAETAPIQKLLNTEYEVDTIELMSVWSEWKGKGHIEWNIKSILNRDRLIRSLKPIDIKSIDEVTPGMVVAERYFQSEMCKGTYVDIACSRGVGGRAAIVVGVDKEKSEIIAIGYSNQISHNRSGIGLDSYKYDANKDQNLNVMQMFFRPYHK